MRRLLRPILFVAALIFLLEAWLWDRLAPIVGWIVSHVLWKKLRTAVTAIIERLPPYATLLVFTVPVVALLPFKLSALWLLAHGHWLLGGGVFLAAKVVGLAITAFLFDVCKPKLMQIVCFSRFYGAVMRAKEWAHTIVEPYKRRIRVIKRFVRMMIPRSARPGYARRVLARLRYRARRAARP